MQQRTYHPGGQVAAVTDADGGLSVVAVDVTGRVVAVSDQAGATTRLEWSPAGRLLATTSPEGRVERCWYDAAGALLGIQVPDGTVSHRASTPLPRPSITDHGDVCATDYDLRPQLRRHRELRHT